MESEKVRQELVAERARLEREVHGLEESLAISIEDSTEETTLDQHPADTATTYVTREVDLGLSDNARAIVQQIDRALEKLDDGTYGVCDNCGRQIADGRLEVELYATLCIDCRRLLEREERVARLGEGPISE